MADLINKINNSAYHLNNIVQQPVSHAKIASGTNNVNLNSQSTKKEIIKYSSLTVGVILIIISIIKRKAITKFFSKLFEKKNNTPANRAGSTNAGVRNLPPDNPPSGCGASSTNVNNINPARPGTGVVESKLPNISEYRQMQEKWSHLPKEDPRRKELGKELYQIEKRMIENNVSFIEKPVFKNVNINSVEFEKEKIHYVKNSLRLMSKNEATAIDALDVFEKYGSRYDDGLFDGMTDLAVAVSSTVEKLPKDIADKVLSRFIDLFGKIARKDKDYTDPRLLGQMIEKYSDKMSTDTVIKYIESMKKWSFEKDQADSVRRFVLRDEFTRRTPKELSRIEEHLKKLEEIVKDLPFKDKSKPNS